jgi:hypothetical protein
MVIALKYFEVGGHSKERGRQSIGDGKIWRAGLREGFHCCQFAMDGGRSPTFHSGNNEVPIEVDLQDTKTVRAVKVSAPAEGRESLPVQAMRVTPHLEDQSGARQSRNLHSS